LSIAFEHVTVVPMDSERLLADHTVVVRDARIVAMGPSSEVATPDGATVINGRGRYLMPGLVDMHTHLAIEEELDLYIAYGVTTVRNMWGAKVHLDWRDRINHRGKIGPRIITAGPIVDGDPPVHDGSLVVRTAEDADRAVALHKEAGYDFVKVYTRLSLHAYQRLVVAAKAAGLPVAGHVPREVGLSGVIDAQQGSIEHLTGFLDALQADSSPVRGKFDRASAEKKMSFIDEAKLPALAQKIRERGVYSCPTRTVLNEIAPSEARERLRRPHMKFVQPLYRAMWEPGKDPPSEELANQERSNALHDRIIRALRDAGAPLLLGTDTGNPLVIPGASVHEELELLVKAGLTPYEALLAATRAPAEFLKIPGELGTVAVGQRADLLLVRENPLTDVAHAAHIQGVMARGRWFEGLELANLVSKVEASVQQMPAWSALPAAPALAGGSKREFAAMFEVVWKGARFDLERIVVDKNPENQRVIQAQVYDGRYGQRSSLRLEAGAGATSDGELLEIQSDGAKGRGQAIVRRTDGGGRGRGRARLSGTLLSGPTFEKEEEMPGGVILGAEQFLASKILLGKRLLDLPVGKDQEIRMRELALGSSADFAEVTLRVVRSPDTTIPFRQAEVPARRYEITQERGPKTVLWLDAEGWPIAFELDAYGATVRWNRIG
jgi:imidazolonepropionase-like amidohydrolase